MDKEDYVREINTFEHFAKANHVNLDLDNMIWRKIMRNQLDLIISLPREFKSKRGEKWIKLSFLRNFSKEYGRTTRPFGFKPSFYNPFALKHLTPLEDSISEDERSGVCKLECPDCSGVSIGETGRKTIIRVSEHLFP